eukprot:SAG11_NODE_1164_length_5623_cov_18.626358_5_plen_119_part_00
MLKYRYYDRRYKISESSDSAVTSHLIGTTDVLWRWPAGSHLASIFRLQRLIVRTSMSFCVEGQVILHHESTRCEEFSWLKRINVVVCEQLGAVDTVVSHEPEQVPHELGAMALLILKM